MGDHQGLKGTAMNELRQGRTQRRGTGRRKGIVAAVVVTVVLALGVIVSPVTGWLPTSMSSDAQAASAKVTICHRTRSVTTPYRLITVNKNAITQNKGHGDHTGGLFDTSAGYYKGSGSGTNTRDWGDILPGDALSGDTLYNGTTQIAKNWDASGQAFFPGGANAPLCRAMTAKEFYDVQVAARQQLVSANVSNQDIINYGLDDNSILADLNEQKANEDLATLAALGGSFTTSNIATSDTVVMTTTDAASSISSTGATVKGTIKAGTVGVRWQFQYGTDSALATSSTTTMSGATDNDVDTITSNTVAVSTPLTGLSASTTYYYRVVGVTNYGAAEEAFLYGSILSFTTAATGTQTVTFHANGGAGSMSSQSAIASTALTSNAFTRTGYTFTGWATNPDGTGTSYANGAPYSFAADVTLYARWSANTYTLSYDANGGSGAPSDSSASTGSSVTLSATQPTRSGYAFASWNTAANGVGSSYAPSASLTMPGANTTLYAQWTAVSGGGNSGGGNSGGGNSGGGNSGGGNSGGGNSVRPVSNGPVTPPAGPPPGNTNQPVSPLPTVTVPLTTGNNTPVVVTGVDNKGPGSVQVDDKGQLKVTVPIGFTGTITVLVKGFTQDECPTTPAGEVACPVNRQAPIQQTVEIPVAGPKPEVVPDQQAAALPRSFAPRSGEVVVLGMDGEVGLNWKPEAGAQYYKVSTGDEMVCMTVYTSCIVPAPNRKSRTYVVTSVSPGGSTETVAKGTGWAKPSGTTLASVYFDSASGKLNKKALRALRKMVRDAKAVGISSVYVVGHTDTRGSITYNRKLSAARALNVRAWLKKYLPDAVFNRQSPKGEVNPKFSERDRPGDWRNRRVDILVQ